jgi:hypothetical protein
MSGQEAHTFPSLAQHFEAPEDYLGLFGWICGYSGDAAFLNAALERFTRQGRAQRASEGRVWLALMLDPGNPAIAFPGAPGIAHLPILDAPARPFALLHAKIALLGFRCQSQPERWLVRLIVSTGNWTCQTLEQSLDLAWRIDLGSEALAGGGPEIRSRCADIAAAWSLLQWVSEHVDRRLLDGGSDGRMAEGGSGGRMAEGALARKKLDGWLAQCGQAAGKTPPRLFDNREASLLAQLPDRIKATGRAVRRNYLAMGSGFYEAPAPCGSLPSVPFEIRDALRDAGLLTRGAEIDLFVNP